MQGARRLKKSRAAGGLHRYVRCVFIHERFRQFVRDRGAVGRASRGAQLAAEVPLRSLCRAIVGTAFTMPQASNQRSWLYRIRPGVKHAGRFTRVDAGLLRTAPAARDESSLPLGQLRWAPVAIPAGELSFVTGLCTVTTAGDADTRSGMAAHYLFVTRSMRDEYFMNCDGELLIVVQENSLRLVTEFGVIEVSPGEICVIPRAVIFRAELIGGPVRGYVCENYGASFTLPDRGPIGANCLANPRDFLVPVARMKIANPVAALCEMGRRSVPQRNRAIAARCRRVARQLRAIQIRFAPFLACGRLAVRPSRSVDLHRSDRALGNAGTANVDFVIFPIAGWLPKIRSARPGITATSCRNSWA